MAERRKTAALAVAALGTSIVVFAGTGASPAAAGAVPQLPVTVEYETVGPGTFTVPCGVTSLSFAVYGAAGGGGNLFEGADNPGGLGGRVTGTTGVTPGQEIAYDIGGVGGTAVLQTGGAGGANGGGAGGSNSSGGGNGGGGGGGMTELVLGIGTVVAGGGGGGGGGGMDGDRAGGAGGGGGTAGSAPGTNQAGSSGGTGGAGGIARDTEPLDTAGGAGSAGQGGAGASSPYGVGGGGGGGGGTTGGGGGASWFGTTSVGGGGGGGGIGAAFDGMSPANRIDAENGGNGKVVLTYTPVCAPTVTITSPAVGAVVGRNEDLIADYTCTDTGDSGITTCSGDVADGTPVDTSVAGPATFTVTAAADDGATTVLTHHFTIVDRTCGGRPVTVYLGAGDTTTPGDDVVLGTPDADDVDGKGGDDVMCLGGGDDTAVGGGGDDRIFGGPGQDRIEGSNGADVLGAGPGGATLLGGPGDDVLRGGDGPETMNGATGDDTLLGRAGNDLLIGESGRDRLFAGAGVDRCKGGSGFDLADSCETASAIP